MKINKWMNRKNSENSALENDSEHLSTRDKYLSLEEHGHLLLIQGQQISSNKQNPWMSEHYSLRKTLECQDRL